MVLHRTDCSGLISEDTYLPAIHDTAPHQQRQGNSALSVFKGFINRAKGKTLLFHSNLQGFEVCFCSFSGTETECP